MASAPSFRHNVHGRKWHTSMFTLFKEPALLLSSVLCPCNAYHEASASFEKDPADWCESVCGGVCFFCGFDLRSRFREKYNLRGNEGQDFCIHCWCNCCGLAQIRREAKLWKDTNTTGSQHPAHPRPGSGGQDRQIAQRPLMPMGAGTSDAQPQTRGFPDIVSNGQAPTDIQMIRPGSISSEPTHGTGPTSSDTRDNASEGRTPVIGVPQFSTETVPGTTQLAADLYDLAEQAEDVLRKLEGDSVKVDYKPPPKE